jgi:hypothetical protein
MKTSLILIAAAIAGVSYIELRAQTPVPASGPTGTTLAYPYNKECIVTLDPRAERKDLTPSQASPSGFEADGTMRGQLVYMSDEWCVLKDGSFENWIPREKVLALRASK